MNSTPASYPRTFTVSAKEGLIGLQKLKDRLRELLPLVPIDREPELFALIALLEALQNDILDDSDPLDEERAEAGLHCIALFRDSLPRNEPEVPL